MFKRSLLILVTYSSLIGCGTWRENVDKTLVWAHQAAKQQSGVVEPYYRLKCGDVVKACKIEMVKSGKSCKSDEECRKSCPSLVSCQDERHAINKAVISVHLAVLSGRQLLIVGEEADISKAVTAVISVVTEMRALSLKYGLFDTPKKSTPVITTPASKPVK